MTNVEREYPQRGEDGVYVADGPGGRKRKCKHYNGIFDNSVCDAGVEYDAVKCPQQFRFRYRDCRLKSKVYTRVSCLPCVPRQNFRGIAYCEHFELPSEEEMREHEASVTRDTTNSLIVIYAILNKEGERRSVKGNIPCPLCEDGTVEYSIASLNGHIRARCSTKDCVRFMQ